MKIALCDVLYNVCVGSLFIWARLSGAIACWTVLLYIPAKNCYNMQSLGDHCLASMHHMPIIPSYGLLSIMSTLIPCKCLPCYLSCSCRSWALKVPTCCFCQLHWISAKSVVCFSCLACLLYIYPWVFWPQVLCMDWWASCILHVHVFPCHVAVVLVSLLLLFIEHVYNSLPWPLFFSKSVFWDSSLASLLHAYPWFFWA